MEYGFKSQPDKENQSVKNDLKKNERI